MEKEPKAHSRERLDKDKAAPVQWEVSAGKRADIWGRRLWKASRPPNVSGWDEVYAEKGREVEGEKKNMDLQGLGRQSHRLGRIMEKTLAKKRLPVRGSWWLPCESCVGEHMYAQ